MLKNILAVLLFFFAVETSFSQDTVRIKRPEDDRYCTLMICVKKSCFTDSMPERLFSDDVNIELRINDKCDTKKRADVFVSSFELSAEADNSRSLSAQSSFFTGPQKTLIRAMKPGEFFIIKNVIVHGPDGFKKMENMKIILK